MKRKRGRPPADRKRNLFVYLLVADFMDIGLLREDAVEVAADLLASNRDAFASRFIRETLLAPKWKPGQKTVCVEVNGESVERPIGARAWLAWEQAWGRRADFGITDRGVVLSPATVGRIYDNLAAELAPVHSIVCADCGHSNVHSPARGEPFVLGDGCRRCGEGTGEVPSDPDPI